MGRENVDPKEKGKKKEEMSIVEGHFHVYNGKRRCITSRMQVDHHNALRDIHRAARLNPQAFVSDDEILTIGVVFHLLTPNTSRELNDLTLTAHKILAMMNAGFGHGISPLHDLHAIEHGEFLQDGANREIYHRHKAVAYAPHVHFTMAGPPNMYYIPLAPRHSGSDVADMDKWDQLLKLQTAPARDPKQLYNIWVVFDIKSVLLGYGNFPKVEPTQQDLSLDGFVYFISPEPYHMHATAVHETGHVYGLQHPFNHTNTDEYDDEIDDTPPQNVPDFGPVWSRKSKWPTSLVKKSGLYSHHNLSNWLNYVDDSCMFMFTKGQCQRIRETALTVRSNWNLTSAQVAGLQGGSPWASRLTTGLTVPIVQTLVQTNPTTTRRKNLDQKAKTFFITQHTAFPFQRKYSATAANSKFKPKKIHIPETSLSTFGGMMDLCGSLAGLATSTYHTLDTAGKMASALSFSCC